MLSILPSLDFLIPLREQYIFLIDPLLNKISKCLISGVGKNFCKSLLPFWIKCGGSSFISRCNSHIFPPSFQRKRSNCNSQECTCRITKTKLNFNKIKAVKSSFINRFIRIQIRIEPFSCLPRY